MTSSERGEAGPTVADFGGMGMAEKRDYSAGGRSGIGGKGYGGGCALRWLWEVGREGAKRKAGGERFLTPPGCGGFGMTARGKRKAGPSHVRKGANGFGMTAAKKSGPEKQGARRKAKEAKDFRQKQIPHTAEVRRVRNDGVRREARMRQETERFLSAQADPSWEMKGRRKSACSVRNDGVRACGRGRRGDGGDRDAERFLTPPKCGGFGMTA